MHIDDDADLLFDETEGNRLRATIRLLGVMPHAHALHLDWAGEEPGPHGETLDVFVHILNNEALHLARDGRVAERVDGELVFSAGSRAAALRRLLPTADTWLALGGYTPGGALADGISAT